MTPEVTPVTDEGGLPPKKKRGRKRKVRTVVRKVRMSIEDYRAYWCSARLARVPVVTAMRFELHMHAPRAPIDPTLLREFEVHIAAEDSRAE